MKKRMSDEQIQNAASVDIVSLCEEMGYALEKKSERYYFGIDHDSLVIDRKENVFHWNSQRISGNAIIFVQTFFNKTFPEAVKMLISNDYQKGMEKHFEEASAQEYVYQIQHDTSTAAVEGYLIQERGIDRQIVSALIKKGLIRQDIKKNCVFVWGSTGQCVGADLQGTVAMNNGNGKRTTFKQISKNSEAHYGFNVSLGLPKSLYFFESPIDLLSYWSLNKNLKECRLISMSGLKRQTVMNMIHHTAASRGTLPVNGIFFGVDNDVAGHKFVDKMEQMTMKAKDGQQIKLQNLIPNDTQIPKEYVLMYQDAAIAYRVDWKQIAAIHKAETNLSETNEISNDFGYGHFFGKPLEAGEKPERVDLQSSIQKCAEVLSKHLTHGTVDLNAVLHGSSYTLDTLEKVQRKVVKYHEAYKNLGYLPVQESIKDWNDKLKEKNHQKQMDRGYTIFTKKPKQESKKQQLTYGM